uniref:FH2 domain-containing protein n=1 Tax=Ciona savignyi TaxID=51511 RepID=H2Z892_CIOSA
MDRFASSANAKPKKGKDKYAYKTPSISEDHTSDNMIPDVVASKLSEHEVLTLFEKMLDDMNLAEEKKEPLRSKDLSTKRAMVVQWLNKTTTGEQAMTPQQFIYNMQSLIRNQDSYRTESSRELLQVLESLRVSLNNDFRIHVCLITQGFGLQFIMGPECSLYDKYSGAKLLICFKLDILHQQHCCFFVLNLFYFFSKNIKMQTNKNKINNERRKKTNSIIYFFGVSIKMKTNHKNNKKLKKKNSIICSWVQNFGREGLDILLRILNDCYDNNYTSDIHNKIKLEIIRCLKAFMNNRYGIRDMFEKENGIVTLCRAIDPKNKLMMIDTVKLVAAVALLEDGHDKVLEALTICHENDLLLQQGSLSDQQRQYAVLPVDFSLTFYFTDASEIFEFVQNTLTGTPSEPFFLSILQHLLSIRDDEWARPQYYRLIEECVSQIILHRSGMDPDFGYRRRFEVDVEPLIDQLVDKAKVEESEYKASESQKQLEQELIARQEADMKFTKKNNELIEIQKKLKEQEALISQLEEKKAFKPETAMKRMNWNAIKVQTIKEKSFWVTAKEEKFESPDLFTRLMATFGQKKIAKKAVEAEKPQKKQKELKVLDSKSAQNLSIFLGTLKVPHVEVKTMILGVSAALDESMVNNLLKQLPEQEMITAVAEYKKQYADLVVAEQFLCTLSDIKRLIPKLQHIKFIRQFDEMVGDIKPNIVSVTAACQDILKGTKFKKFLELVLLIGNYMNSGSRNAQTFGFDISYLTKLKDTKNTENTFNMLNFLAGMIEEQKEKRYSEVHGFIADLKHVHKAQRVSGDQLMKSMSQMKAALSLLQKDVEAFSKSKDPEDKFSEQAMEQYSLLEDMYENMKSLYESIAEFFSFNIAKKSMEDFFSEVNTFKEDYLVRIIVKDVHYTRLLKMSIIRFNAKSNLLCIKCILVITVLYKVLILLAAIGILASVTENQRRKELEEKQKRAKLAKEKAEKEKEERKKRRQPAGVDLDAGDQEGVMDSLLEALSSGKAFKKEGRRRTPR